VADKSPQSVAYHRAYSRALYRLRDQYSELFEQMLEEEYAALGYTFREIVPECTVCGDPARCAGLCNLCYAYERRTGTPRPQTVIDAYRKRKAVA